MVALGGAVKHWLGLHSPDTLVEELASGATDTSAPLRAAFRERFNPLDDGHAAARVVDAVFGDDAPGVSAPGS